MSNTTLTEIAHSTDLIKNLTLRELRGKYRSSVLGWLWSLLNPLSTILTYWFVFGLILQLPATVGTETGLDNFPVYLMCGLFPWAFFSSCVNGSMGVIVGNAALIKKVYFPRAVLPLSYVLSILVNFCIEMTVLIVLLALFGVNALVVLPWLLILMVMLVIFTLGISMAVSVLNAYLRDLQHLIGSVLLQVLFYLNPIVYRINDVPKNVNLLGFSVPLRAIYLKNPMARFVMAFRRVLYDGAAPAFKDFVFLGTASVLSIVLGWMLFSKLEWRMAEEL